MTETLESLAELADQNNAKEKHSFQEAERINQNKR